MTTFDIVMLAVLAVILIVIGFRWFGGGGGSSRKLRLGPWLIALIAMIVVNAALWFILGPRGGFGLFLFLPFLFVGGRRKNE